MAYSSLILCLSVACAAVTGFSLQDSNVYESFLSALTAVEDQAKRSEELIPSLQEDIEEFSEASSLLRPKRNAMEKHRIYPKCCGSGDKPDFTEETVLIFANCKEHLNASEEHTEAAACDIAACIGREKGALNAEGYVIEEEFVKLIEEAYTDESLKNAARRAGPECVKKANEIAKQMNDSEPLEYACNLAGIMAYHCTKYEVIMNCPEDEIVNSEECHKFRQVMQEWKNK